MAFLKSSKFPNSKPVTPTFNINDTVSFALYPNKFFLEGGHNQKNIDMMPKVFDEKSRKFVINPNMIGIVEELFLNRVTREPWVLLYNYYLDMYFSIPMYNVLRVEVSQ